MYSDDFHLTGGVVLIGSLYWENDDIRKKWRESHLNMRGEQEISLPICYGRESSSRENTYTMVYSTKLKNSLGNGYFIPFRNSPMKSMNEIHDYALGMINAETKCKPYRGYYWEWGALGFKLNPDKDEYSEIKKLFEEYWKERLNYKNQFDSKKFAFEDEDSILDDSGELQFDWAPNLENYDFILTAVTEPEDSPPKGVDIAKRMCEKKYYEYFFNNIISGINTHQDDEILEFFEQYLL